MKYTSTEPYYRQGVTYPPGAVIDVPEGVKPGRTWTPYEEPKPAAAPATSAEPKGKSKRPSDGDPI